MRNRQRREAQLRGQIEIKKPVFTKLMKACPRFDYYKEDWEYRDESDAIYIPIRRFTPEEIQILIRLMCESTPKPMASISQLEAHLEVILHPQKGTIGTLILLESAIMSYLRKNIVEGWIFVREKGTGILEPYLVESVVYHSTQHNKEYTIPAHTTVRGTRWYQGKQDTDIWTWHANELGKSVDLLLLDRGIIHENPKLVEEYYKQEKVFLEWRKSMGKQFLGNGSFTSKHASNWGREHDADMHNTRIVVDDKCGAIERRKGTGLFQDLEEDTPALDPEKAERYTIIPLTFYVWVFNLDSHNDGWVHIDHMKPYVYKPELREKLILPPEHQDLIDALTANKDVLLDDIISGKSGGTAIICQGKSGTGKTLTAEVYAEVAKVPLYRVHSGQLGIEAEGVETQLKEALNRAKRWGALLLIDEADVFVMQRGENLDLNAVCGVFLRLLEYFDGLIFLTTNRLDTIDDAILSRCIARIQFDVPGPDERARLWRTLGDVYGLKLVKDAKLVKKLAEKFDKATGRDIKGLIRLSIKYAQQKKRDPTFADIERFAPYRGM